MQRKTVHLWCRKHINYMHMKNHLHHIVVLLILPFMLIGCTSNEEQLKKYVNEMNRDVYPKQLGEEIWLDSLSVLPGLTVGTYYSFTDVSKDDFTPEMLEAMKLNLKIEVLKSVTSNDKDAKRFRNAGVTFYFECSDWEGNYIFDITVTPEDYKRAME